MVEHGRVVYCSATTDYRFRLFLSYWEITVFHVGVAVSHISLSELYSVIVKFHLQVASWNVHDNKVNILCFQGLQKLPVALADPSQSCVGSDSDKRL